MRNQVAILFGARAVASLSQAIALILLARWTEVSSFALVGSLLGAGMVVIALLDLGLGTYVLRHAAVGGKDDEVAFALKLNLLTGAIGLMGVTAALVLAAQFDLKFYSMIPLGVWMVLEKNSDVLLNVAIARGSTSVAAYSILTRRLSALAAFLILVSTGADPLFSFTSSLAVGGILGLLDSRKRVQKITGVIPNQALRLRSVSSLFSTSKHYWFANLTNQFRNLDTLLVTAVSSATAGGFYAAGVRLTNPMLLGTGSIASVILPTATGHSPAQVRQLNKKLLFVIGLGIPILVLAGWPFGLLGASLLGDGYSDAQPVIQIMLVSTFIVGMCPVVGALVQSQGGQQAVARTGTVFVPVILGGVVGGALIGGAIGAAAGLGLAFLLKLSALEVNLVNSLPRQNQVHDQATSVLESSREASDEN